MSQQKLQQVIDQLQRNETKMALKEINKFLSKEKNLQKLAKIDLNKFKLLKGNCLIKCLQYGEALQILYNFINENKFEGDLDLYSWLENTAISLKKCDLVRKHLEEYAKNNKQEEFNIKYFNTIIKENNLELCAKQANKLYQITKNLKFLFIGIIFQNANPLSNLVLLESFIQKLAQGYQIEKGIMQTDSPEISKQVVRLQTNLFLKQKNFNKVIQNIENPLYNGSFDNYQLNLHLYHQIYQEVGNQETLLNIVRLSFKLFKNNLNIENYLMIYETYRHFIKFLFDEQCKKLQNGQNQQQQQQQQIEEQKIQNNNVQQIQQQQQKFQINVEKIINCQQQQYTFDEVQIQNLDDIEDLLGLFYISLKNHKKILQDQNKDHHHFKNALKCVLQAQIYTLSLILERSQDANSNFVKIEQEFDDALTLYIEIFSQIITLPEELIQNFELIDENQWKLIGQKILVKIEQKISQIQNQQSINYYISLINKYKLELIYQTVDLSTNEKIFAYIKVVLTSYKQSLEHLYPQYTPVEKGERLFTDDFIIIAADVLWDQVQKHQTLENENVSELITIATSILETGLRRSNYNFDIQTRLLLFYGMIGNYERYMLIYNTMDIKAVQFDTIGYIFQKMAFQYNLCPKFQDLIDQALLYYAENLRESNQVIIAIISSFKFNNFEQLDEFRRFNSVIDRSYIKFIYIFCKGQFFQQQNQKQQNNQLDTNAKYFLDQIYENFYQDKLFKLTFNLDLRVVQPVAAHVKNKESQFYKDVLGLYNNQQYLLLQTISIFMENQLQMVYQDEFQKEKCLQNFQIFKDCQQKFVDQKDKLFDYSHFEFHNRLPYYLRSFKIDNNLQSQDIFLQFQFEVESIQIQNLIIEYLLKLNDFQPQSTEYLIQLENSIKFLCNSNLIFLLKIIKILLAKQFVEYFEKCLIAKIESFSLIKQNIFFYDFYKIMTLFLQRTNNYIILFLQNFDASNDKLYQASKSKKLSENKKQIQQIMAENNNLSKIIVELYQKLISICINSCDQLVKQITNQQMQLYRTIANKNITNNFSLHDILSQIQGVNFSQLMQDLDENINVNYKYLCSILVGSCKDIQTYIQKLNIQ